MKKHNRFNEMSLSSINPQGWIKQYLLNQKNGLTGNLENAKFPFNSEGWAADSLKNPDNGKTFFSWWPYEQIGYWIDGMIRCGYLLGDQSLIDKAKSSTGYVLNNPKSDGFLGPELLRDNKPMYKWPYAVFFRALMAEYLTEKDPDILLKLSDHYKACSLNPADIREVCNIEQILFVYEHTGDKTLLEKAKKLYKDFNETSEMPDTTLDAFLSDKIPFEHGVTYNETAKLGAIMYIWTGNERYLDASVNASKKIDRHHMLVSGVCSSSERLTTTTSLDSHETCDIADYTWNMGYLLMAEGKTEYADKIERACFNAAPGAVTPDFKALQYFSCPNQVIADKKSNHNRFHFGESWMSYRPNPGTECCPGQVNRIIPDFAARMWMTDNNEGVAAVLYGPSSVSVKAGKNRQEVEIFEETHYPFSEKITFRIKTSDPVEFSFTLRIPSWCSRPEIFLNDTPFQSKDISSGAFFTIRRNFKNNDKIVLQLPMEIKIRRWPENGLSIERGPLVFSLPVRAKKKIDKKDKRSTKDFPAWNMYPKSPWNYALSSDDEKILANAQISFNPYSEKVWMPENAPVQIKVPAKRVNAWKLDKKKNPLIRYILPSSFVYYKKQKKGTFTVTPPLPPKSIVDKSVGKREEYIKLIPYGCTDLRVTIFPEYSE